MPASSFSSRAAKLAFIALTVFAAPSCRSLEIWGQAPSEIRRRLQEGDNAFLREVDFGKHSVDEALQLGEGAPYLLGLAYQSLGLEPQAQQLFRLQVVQGDTPWNALAMAPLLEILLRNSDYDAAYRLAADHLAYSPEPMNRDLVRKSLVEALYWTKDDRATLAALAVQFPSGRSASRPDLDPELALFRAVASSRAAVAGWQDLYLRLCLDHPASTVHVRASQFLAREEAISSGLPAAVRGLVDAKASLASRAPARALPGLQAAVAALAEGVPPSLLREASAAYLAAGESARGARFLARTGQALAGPARLAALEAAGRLYRAAGANGEATTLLASVVAATPDPDQRDRATWYMADVAGRASTRAGVAELARGRGSWHTPLYFDDLIDELTTRLLSENDREGLRALFAAVSGLEVPSRIRLYYILHRLGERDLPGEQAILAARTTTVMEDYYRLLLDAEGQPFAGEVGEPDAPGDMDFLLTRLLDFGLYDRAVALARENGPSLSRGALRTAAQRLAGRQRYKDAITLVGNGYPWDVSSREIALAAYPRAFDREVRELAGRENLEARLLFAMAREESAFDPAIVSSAGAVGLTQLLPATAAEEARRMRVSSYDLRSPADNLSIGFHYFGRLARLQGSIPFALAAYNAGLTRIRQWKQQYAHLPPDLIFEAIPFEETRHYLRKVLVSAAIYGELYDKVPAGRTIEMFYPPAEPR